MHAIMFFPNAQPHYKLEYYRERRDRKFSEAIRQYHLSTISRTFILFLVFVRSSSEVRFCVYGSFNNITNTSVRFV